MSTTTEQIRFIECKFSPGMVGNELAVSILIGGVDFSLFVDEKEVKVLDKEKGEGLLRVRVWDQNNGIVALPAETLEQGRKFLRLPLENLVAA